MRVNLPVTQREYDYPADHMLVSTTDTKGVITHCNHAFIATSGYTWEELVGQPHNLIRHPDMPPEAYKDMWATIGRGMPWTGLVKNRRKNGDHYWVQANVTPILQGQKPIGYMSVRTKPTRQQVDAASALYTQMHQARESGKTGPQLRAGQVLRTGPAGWLDAWSSRTPSLRLGVWGGLLLAVVFLVGEWRADGLGHLAQALMCLGGGAAMLTWIHHHLVLPLQAAKRAAADLAACNLVGAIPTHFAPPMGDLMRGLSQIQLNLRAVIGDVRTEIEGFSQASSEIAQGAMDLSARTESQASSLEETAASMEELSSTVKQTADTAGQVSARSEQSTQIALQGGEAMSRVGHAMHSIEASSNKITEIIKVIEGIAFQTNILALNAAVEAARAGEQGRGFAVVASEVRALAQRSAAAAKEIRELINTSVGQIAAGAGEMDSAGRTIADVVESVQVVSQLVRQITGATKEQSTGISQVNEAVTQLDTVTQQNAALVEQSAAAASNLSHSAATLGRSVQVFHLR